MLSDIRVALRGLRRSPAFTAVAISSLALGIGANVAIFSFVDAILLKQLPVDQPQRLVHLVEYEGSKETNSAFSYPMVQKLAEGTRIFDGVLGRFPVRVNLMSSGAAEPLHGEVVTAEYFKTLGVRAALGRLITDDDIRAAAANPVCVISYSMWQQRFAGDPAIIGRKLILNSRGYRVIGVTEKNFYGSQFESPIDMQLPVSRMGDFMGGFFANGPGGSMWKSSGFTWLQVLARLQPGLTRAQAQSMVQPQAHQIEAELAGPGQCRNNTDTKTTMRLLDGSQGINWTRSQFAQPVTVLMMIVGLVLLIACVNLASLLLARANARQKEFAVRLSLGASRLRLIAQLMVESMVLSISGALLGLLVSTWLVHSLLTYLNAGAPMGGGIHVTVDSFVLCFCVGLSFATAVLFGLTPAWQSARADILPGLKQTGNSAAVSGERALLRKSLVIVQIALSLVILFAAGLLTRTLSKLETVDLGFEARHVITLSADPAMIGHPPAETNRLFDEMLSRIRAIPGVDAASVAVVTPLTGAYIELDVEVPGHVPKNNESAPGFNMVSPGYFATLHQRLLQGRDFSDHDSERAPRVVIVNQQFASQYWPGENPIGRRFKQDGRDVEVVGLVNTARFVDLRETPRPVVYVPYKQMNNSGYSLLVDTRGDTRRAIGGIRRAIRSVDPKIPIYDIRTLQSQIDHGISSERVLSFLSVLFSALATLLSGIGLYGLIAYAVSRRTREIGVRMAVGAQRSDVAGLFLRESALLLSAGVAIGLPLALAATRTLKTLLYGLQPTDVPTLVVTAAVLIIACLFATFLPVRRAARIEPLEALRYE
jgi:predicted permease